MLLKVVNIYILLLHNKQVLSGIFLKTPIESLRKNNFNEAVKSDMFVDKTHFISEFFKQKFMLITAPKRFGKSINLNMLKRFFEIQVHQNGTHIDREDTVNYKLFKDNNLKIMKNKSFVDVHFGRYPTVYFNFRGLSANTFREFIYDFKTMIGEVYSTTYFFFILAKGENNKRFLRGVDWNKFILYYDVSKVSNCHVYELVHSGGFLTEIMSRYFKRKVFVYINEIDSTIQDGILKLGRHEAKIIAFIKKFMHILLNPTFVEKAYLSGCTSFSKLLLPDTREVAYFPFTEKHVFNELHGYTKKEMAALLKKLKRETRLTAVFVWYDCYRIPSSKLRLFNPRSLHIYLLREKLDDYWIYSMHLVKLRRFIRKKPIRDMIDDYNLREISSPWRFYPILNYTVDDVIRLKKVYEDHNYKTRLTKNETRLSLHFLVDLGYLNVKEVKKGKWVLEIPNKEIDTYFMEILHPV